MLAMFAVACSLPASTAVYSISPALRLDGKAPSMPDRRAQRRVLLNLGAAMLVSPTAARAFDLPLLDISLTAAMIPYTLEDAEARRRYAAKANPPLPRQQACVNYAVTTGDIESLQAMAEGGWSLADLVDDGGKTPLHRAAQQGNEAAIRLLVKAVSPIDAYTQFRETPLHLAVRNNRLACVKLLVEAGASTAALYSKTGDTALTLAQKYRFESIVEYLKGRG
mmetsp:Transcript_43030/g.132585  ORF Transcript_43030/g.132585 Transcript_43030/m.132585 type:complete len:223 (-) Transcript_43030:176-844(-)